MVQCPQTCYTKQLAAHPLSLHAPKTPPTSGGLRLISTPVLIPIETSAGVRQRLLRSDSPLVGIAHQRKLCALTLPFVSKERAAAFHRVTLELNRTSSFFRKSCTEFPGKG